MCARAHTYIIYMGERLLTGKNDDGDEGVEMRE